MRIKNCRVDGSIIFAQNCEEEEKLKIPKNSIAEFFYHFRNKIYESPFLQRDFPWIRAQKQSNVDHKFFYIQKISIFPIFLS